MTIETQVKVYKDDGQMKRGIRKMERNGWTVGHVQEVEQGWSFINTCCLGIIFLPLALLGKKPKTLRVTFQRAKK